jgi:monothiol glutaredoxin
MLDAGEKFVFVDVRTPEEREHARIPGTRLLDDSVRAELEALERDTPIVFHCHHGGRSQRAAEHFAALGFRNVANLAGGIDAWSQQVDPSVPRY